MVALEVIMDILQVDKHTLYDLIDKITPCVAMGSKEAIKQFKKLAKGQVKIVEITDNDTFLSDGKIYLLPLESSNKPIKVIIGGK